MGDSRLDARVNAYREDLADVSLKDLVKVPKYVEGQKACVVATTAPIRQSPRFDSPLDTQALYGEALSVFDEAEGWAWVQLDRDGYVGYMPAECFSYQKLSPSHRICSLGTFVYPAPDIKLPPLKMLCMNSLVEITQEEGKFLRVKEGGYIYSAHAVPCSNFENDFVEVAQRFASIPYLWGGCSKLGIDCSGLVQQSLLACGYEAPRDSDMQERDLGDFLAAGVSERNLIKGDLVFWKGHVGLMVDSENFIHANGYHMATKIEPIQVAVERIAEMYGEVTSVKRIGKVE